ncbi:MAG: NmrA family NAD(P)-binding protein [Planctomycetes bacterium]|nr:NmrA family NAD(P)-binding protein [Planctomycetota bacterium]
MSETSSAPAAHPDNPEPSGAPAENTAPQAGQPATAASSSSARTFEIRTVAVVGEPGLAVPGLVRALLDSGINVRVLCPDAATELEILSLKPVAPVDAAPGATVPTLEPVRGSVEHRADLEKLFKDADGAAFLSPVGLRGRAWRPEKHLADLKLAIETAEEAHVAQIAYLSTIAVDPKSEAPCLREAAEAEKMLESSRLADFIFRAGPLMGPKDGLVARTVDDAAGASPFLWLWGYGDTMVQPIHASDLGLCITRCFLKRPENLKPGVYSVAGKDALSLLELVDRALEKKGRFKLKFHVPFFALRLVMLLGDGSTNKPGNLGERVRLLLESFTTDRNDAPRLLGAQRPLTGLEKTQDELLALAT